MSNLLYYPYINLPRTDWTLRVLLYYDDIGSIVPEEYFYDPEKKYDEFMLELVRNGLVTPINPLHILDNSVEITQPFLQLVENNQQNLRTARNGFRRNHRELIHLDKFPISRIHAGKFDENLLYRLEELGLAQRSDDRWYSVEKRTASNLMTFLATVIGAKTNRLPTTDYIRVSFNRSTFDKERQKRETILKALIPMPGEINLNRLLSFKEKHSRLLKSFRTRVELIALDPHIIEGTPLFDQHLAELLQRKEELTEKMKEVGFKQIFFGAVCGLIGAYQGIPAELSNETIIGGLPGFASAVYSALQIERAENVFDQSGLKYLALADKRLRRIQF